MDGWFCIFTFFSAGFQSYQDLLEVDCERLCAMNGCISPPSEPELTPHDLKSKGLTALPRGQWMLKGSQRSVWRIGWFCFTFWGIKLELQISQIFGCLKFDIFTFPTNHIVESQYCQSAVSTIKNYKSWDTKLLLLLLFYKWNKLVLHCTNVSKCCICTWIGKQCSLDQTGSRICTVCSDLCSPVIIILILF